MSKGQFQPRTQSMRVLRSCKNKSNQVLVYDVDKGEADYVTIDTAESSYQGSKRPREMRSNDKPPFNDFITIDDEENNDASSRTSHPASSSSYNFEDNDDGDECLIYGAKGKATTESSKKVNMFCRSRNRVSLNPKRMNCTSARKNFDLETSESEMSENSFTENEPLESDSSDCEIIDDSSGNIQKDWEKASLKKKLQEKAQFRTEDHGNALESNSESGKPFCGTTNGNVKLQDDIGKLFSCPRQSADVEDCHAPDTSSEKNDDDPDCFMEDFSSRANQFSSSFTNIGYVNRIPSVHEKGDIYSQEVKEPSFTEQSHGYQYFKDNITSFLGEFPKKYSLYRGGLVEEHLEKENGNIQGKHDIPFVHETPGTQHKASLATGETSFSIWSGGQQKPMEACSSAPFDNTEPENCPIATETIVSETQGQNDLMGDREKHKESEEYRRAAKEEWASRQEQLRIQAEEAQRLRKKKKAERRLLEMERRQKQRLEEVRESQKKDEETLSLKEKFRSEVRMQLDKMELQYRDMASLLRGLGIQVGGGTFPLPCEVNAAYKKALLRFHPDRASRTDIKQQVEAEEKFKLISRLKEKLLPVAY